MSDAPLAYFLTWTCYGTWLPGDERGWIKWHRGDQLPQPRLAVWCAERMVERPLLLNAFQREVVHATIEEHCEFRRWRLHAVNCRSNHCHCVVTAVDHNGEEVRDQLKSWCTRRLKDAKRAAGVAESAIRQHWWTAKGSVRHVCNEESLEAAILYTLEAQDIGGSYANDLAQRRKPSGK